MPITDLKTHFADGGTAVNGWCAIPSSITAEIVGRAGFDMVTVDLQHGLIDYQMAVTMCQVLQGLPAPVLARVPWNEPGIIMKCLDAGFSGLICPMINTADDARRLVEAARYAPLGGRSFGPTRANMVHGAAYARNANGKVAVFAMIETREALSNLDAILSVEGIDGVYVGPSDLGLSLGHEPTLEPTAAEVIEAITQIAARTRAASRIAGVHTGSPSMVRSMLDQGFHFASLLTDVRLFTNALSRSLADVRETKARTVSSY
ncbi:HpcH/HpaI aldolase/citrate lyase family protein [Rhodobacter sp. SY28-1]|uniref:HpcH/HpaI aldolase family protein n=1 Tax=Rhodobacter sp. SY28-1 TaxID=2562317 RepID=UPI0010C12962|nr:aldolase/citrate lyase family protein [Rhodobacter sp. SY28-1]